jgi:hypothetical protein
MRQVVTAAAPTLSDDAKDRTPERMDTEPAKWALGGLIVLRTAREWQAHQAGFPCRLMEDL